MIEIIADANFSWTQECSSESQVYKMSVHRQTDTYTHILKVFNFLKSIETILERNMA